MYLNTAQRCWVTGIRSWMTSAKQLVQPEGGCQVRPVVNRMLEVYRSWFLGHFARGNHAAAPVLGKSAWRTAAGVRWPWRSTSQAWL